MVVAVARVVVHIPASQSLKDKRQVVKSLLAQVRRQFEVSAAETEDQDKWQVAVLAVACVSGNASHAEEVVHKAVHFIDARKSEADVLEYQTDVVHLF